MRTVETKIFDFNELSDSAKETAFENWLEGRQNNSYAWSDEVSSIIDHIENETPIRVEDLTYDTCNYSYYLGVSGYHGKDDDKYHVTGLRAAKIVLAMYYDITKQNLYYVKELDKHSGKLKFNYLEKRYLSEKYSKRLTAFYSYEKCFTGYGDSETFSRGLLDSVRNNTSKDYTVLDHFTAAFNRMFKSVVSDYEALQSKEYFIENDAYYYDYLENGEQYSATGA